MEWYKACNEVVVVIYAETFSYDMKWMLNYQVLNIYYYYFFKLIN